MPSRSASANPASFIASSPLLSCDQRVQPDRTAHGRVVGCATLLLIGHAQRHSLRTSGESVLMVDGDHRDDFRPNCQQERQQMRRVLARMGRGVSGGESSGPRRAGGAVGLRTRRGGQSLAPRAPRAPRESHRSASAAPRGHLLRLDRGRCGSAAGHAGCRWQRPLTTACCRERKCPSATSLGARPGLAGFANRQRQRLAEPCSVVERACRSIGGGRRRRSR